jgi:tetratricopeptide (TPR) repeat protein
MEFDARLARSRGADRKAQYLRIQATHLFEAGQPHLTRAALALVDRLIAEFPDPFQLAPALALRAEALVDLGRTDEALQTYERALNARRAFPQVGDDGYLGYADSSSLCAAANSMIPRSRRSMSLAAESNSQSKSSESRQAAP